MILAIRIFFKAKNKILYIEYEVKTKMIQEQWLKLKIKFLLDYNMKIVI